jgi:hypothetical protein
MAEVTTAITLYILAALAFPHLIRNRTYYLAALSALILIIGLDMLDTLVGSGGFHRFAAVFIGIFQITAILLLVASAGQLTLNQLGGDFGNMIEVIRRGETTKEVIVPLSDSAKTLGEWSPQGARRARRDEDDTPKVYTIDDPSAVATNPPAQPNPPPAATPPGPLPLD